MSKGNTMLVQVWDVKAFEKLNKEGITPLILRHVDYKLDEEVPQSLYGAYTLMPTPEDGLHDMTYFHYYRLNYNVLGAGIKSLATGYWNKDKGIAVDDVLTLDTNLTVMFAKKDGQRVCYDLGTLSIETVKTDMACENGNELEMRESIDRSFIPQTALYNYMKQLRENHINSLYLRRKENPKGKPAMYLGAASEAEASKMIREGSVFPLAVIVGDKRLQNITGDWVKYYDLNGGLGNNYEGKHYCCFPFEQVLKNTNGKCDTSAYNWVLKGMIGPMGLWYHDDSTKLEYLLLSNGEYIKIKGLEFYNGASLIGLEREGRNGKIETTWHLFDALRKWPAERLINNEKAYDPNELLDNSFFSKDESQYKLNHKSFDQRY